MYVLHHCWAGWDIFFLNKTLSRRGWRLGTRVTLFPSKAFTECGLANLPASLFYSSILFYCASHVGLRWLVCLWSDVTNPLLLQPKPGKSNHGSGWRNGFDFHGELPFGRAAATDDSKGMGYMDSRSHVPLFGPIPIHLCRHLLQAHRLPVFGATSHAVVKQVKM